MPCVRSEGLWLRMGRVSASFAVRLCSTSVPLELRPPTRSHRAGAARWTRPACPASGWGWKLSARKSGNGATSRKASASAFADRACGWLRGGRGHAAGSQACTQTHAQSVPAGGSEVRNGRGPARLGRLGALCTRNWRASEPHQGDQSYRRVGWRRAASVFRCSCPAQEAAQLIALSALACCRTRKATEVRSRGWHRLRGARQGP